MKQPKVSIIVPIFNVELYLVRCIESLLIQTLKDIEIILVDDGSPDSCPLICDEYAQKDSRIKVIHKKNEGLGMARNSGIEIATGKYIAFLDSDDRVEPNMYEILYNRIISSNADLVFCNYKSDLGNGQYVNKIDFKNEVFFEKEDIHKLSLDTIASAPGVKKERAFMFSVWKSIFRLDLIKNKQIKFVSERQYVSEDLPFLLSYFKESSKILFIPDVLYIYTATNSNSLTKQLRWSKVEATVNFYHLLNELMVADDDTIRLRTNRLLIGYFREYLYIICAMKIGFSEKINFIKRLNNLDEWNDIRGYRAIDLPCYNGLIYFFQKNNLTLLSMLAVSIIKILKNYKDKIDY